MAELEGTQFEPGRSSIAASDPNTRARAIIDSACDNAILAMNDDGVIIDWSTGAEQLFGWDASEMIGRDALRLFTPDDRAANIPEREFTTAKAEGRASDERWHMRKDGSHFYAHGAMTLLRGADTSGFVKAVRDITQEHTTRTELEAARRSAELMTSAARLGTFNFAPATGTLNWDDGCRAMFGLPPGSSITYADAFLAGVHPDDRAGADAAVAAALDPTGDGRLEIQYRTIGIEDGVLRYIAARGQAFFENDQATMLLGTTQDVTEVRLAEDRLRETEQRLRLASRATRDTIWDWNIVTGTVTWNEAIEHAFGYPPAAIQSSVGWWMERIHPDDRSEVERGMRAVVGSKDTDWTSDYRFRRADGSYADVRDRGFVIRGADGKPLRMIGAMLDQSERMSVERQLRGEATDLKQQVEDGEAEIDRMWAASPDLMVLLDAAGTYRQVNPAWGKVLGYGEAELIGMDCHRLVHPEDVARNTEALDIARAGSLPPFLNRLRHKDGSYRWMSWVGAPSGDDVVAIGRDMTAAHEGAETLRQTEDALRQSQKVEAVGQLTGGVAHDFNNLLTVIRGSVDLLRRPNLSDERRTRYIDAIGDTADRAAKLTGQLLAFARRQTLQPQVFDASENIASIAGMLGTLTGSRIKRNIGRSELPAFVEADPSQFDTAIVNMAVNARDAMNGEGTLTIDVLVADAMPARRSHAGVPGKHVAVSITDTGTGIAPDQIDRIFEPFFTTKGVGSGTGLGLSQVIGFAKQSGGDVVVTSELGEGTTFTLYLPLVAERIEGEDAEAQDVPLLEDGRCILIVEDNEDVGDFAKQALAELGHSSVLASDADMALAELKRRADRFDLVFTDVVMPGRSGIELAEEITSLYPHLPVVLTSGYSHIIAEEGTKGYTLLRKPYSLVQLAKVLGEAVARHKAGEQ